MRWSLRQRILLWWRGSLYLRHEERPEWSAPIAIYLVKCPRHGFFEDYRHGWGHHFHCPECFREREFKMSLHGVPEEMRDNGWYGGMETKEEGEGREVKT